MYLSWKITGFFLPSKNYMKKIFRKNVNSFWNNESLKLNGLLSNSGECSENKKFKKPLNHKRYNNMRINVRIVFRRDLSSANDTDIK